MKNSSANPLVIFKLWLDEWPPPSPSLNFFFFLHQFSTTKIKTPFILLQIDLPPEIWPLNTQFVNIPILIFFFWIPHIKELVTLFINIFKILFYEYMLGNRSTSFMNILLIVKRVEWAIKDKRINKIVKHKKWRNVYKKEVKVHHVHGWSHLLAKRL